MSQENEKGFVFEKANYMMLAGGLVLVIIGFFLMSGGVQKTPTYSTQKYLVQEELPLRQQLF